MVLANSEVTKAAREMLSGKWGGAIGASVVAFIVLAASSVVPFGGLLTGGPIMVGLAVYFLALSKNDEHLELSLIFKGFNKFGQTFLAYILIAIFTVLWSLLLIVPGIIAAFSYSMTYYIMADNPEVTASSAIAQSKLMMIGHKMRLFMLILRFFGWAIVSVLTLGIGFFWLIPYVNASIAVFYNSIKDTSPENMSQYAPQAAPEAPRQDDGKPELYNG